MLIPFQWIGLFAAATVFAVMFSIGLMLGREQIAAAMQRGVVLLAVLFAVVVPVPALAVLALKVFDLTGPIAVGIVLMSISPRRAHRAAARAGCGRQPRIRAGAPRRHRDAGCRHGAGVRRDPRLDFRQGLHGHAVSYRAPGVLRSTAPADAGSGAARHPGLALVIATVNRAPFEVTAAVIGYALGLAVTIIVYLQGRKRRQ